LCANLLANAQSEPIVSITFHWSTDDVSLKTNQNWAQQNYQSDAEKFTCTQE